MDALVRGILVAVALGGAAQAAEPLTREEGKLVSELGFDAALMQRIKASGTGFERLKAMNDNGDELPAAGLVLLTAPKQGESVVQSLRRGFAGTGYQAWLNDNAYGYRPDKVAILKTHDQVVARYRQWAPKYGLVLTGAGMDWLSARITKPPADWAAFAAEVAKFCPDIVEQGTGDVPSLTREMRENRVLYLWWD
jgi:hypothetical protein